MVVTNRHFARRAITLAKANAELWDTPDWATGPSLPGVPNGTPGRLAFAFHLMAITSRHAPSAISTEARAVQPSPEDLHPERRIVVDTSQVCWLLRSLANSRETSKRG